MTAIDLAKSFYQAVGAGDADAVVNLLHADVRWTEAEGFPYYQGTWTSPQQVLENLLVPLGQDWDGFTVAPDEFFTDGDVVVCLGNYSGTSKATGKAMHSPFMHRWEAGEGKLKTFVMLADTLLVDRALTAD